MIFHSASLFTAGVDKPAGAKDLTITSTPYHARMVPVGARVVTLGIFSQLYPQISQPLLACS